jgi:trimeric autotransporter adhesin
MLGIEGRTEGGAALGEVQMADRGVRPGGGVVAAVVAALLVGQVAAGQQGVGAATVQAPAQSSAAAAQTAAPAAAQGGTIKGSVVAGAAGAGKAGAIPLPGVAVTATNTLTGKKYATATGIDGVYAMTIPRNGRYVVKAELAGFAAAAQEVMLTGVEAQAAAQAITIVPKATDFGMELASRAAAANAVRQAAGSTTTARGLQSLSLSAGGLDGSNASVGGAANAGAALPTLAGVGDGAADSVAVSGQQGTTNGLANFSEDEIRSRIEDAVAQGRASGMIQQGGDPTNAIVGMLGGMMGGGGPGGPGGGRGGGGGRSGSGAFRNFNPAQPHGSVFYQGGNSGLNSAPWSPTLLPQYNPSAYSNRYGVSIAGAPYIPGLTKPNTKQFVFINLTGQKNLNAFLPNPVRVPTDLERSGDFSQSVQVVNGAEVPVAIYNPATGQPFATGANGQPASVINIPLSAQALALLKYYPEPNIVTSDPTAYNYQTISNAGSNNVAINSRYVRNFGQATNTPFGGFGGGGGSGGSARRSTGGANTNAKTPPALRQNINLGYNYSHAASDQRNIFLPLGGATESNGFALNAGYTISYGRLSNNASGTWNRSSAKTRNYFTDTDNDPTTGAGIDVPNKAGSIADARFYNGLPSLNITNFAGLSNTTPSATINQTISFSDFVSYRHKKHNMRYGFDIRRVHADSVGGNDPLGSFSFTGYTTESPADQVATATGSAQQATTGSGFADFLLGLPTQTSLQAGLNKIYLRENVYDWYVNDDYRIAGNVTLNYGLRYEYFGPYVEKFNRLVNLDHNADFTEVDPVLPGGVGTYGGKYPRSLVNPDYTMYSPRFGFAWRPKSKLAKDTVVRGGYGINFNTGQFATFAKSLSFQPPFANTQTNALTTVDNATGCTETNMTLGSGFGCSTTAIQNNYAVNRDYRLGMVQSFNLNIQRTIPLGIVLNAGYNLGKGSGLDVVRAPNHTVSTVTTSDAEAFTYEDSIAGSHSNQLVVSAQKRQAKGIALGVTYTYAHAIDNASSIGGGGRTIAQNDQRLDLEEGNSSFDQRHNLTGNWVLELPFGPNRAFFNKGGAMSHALDGFSLSGTFTFATGNYFTPQYSSSAAQELAGGNYTLRPDRVFSEPIKGAGTLNEFFNKAAFVKPANGFGTASRDSIEGPGTVAVTASLSRTFALGDTRSFETRVTASNVFNTVQYSGINTTVNSATYGQVTSAAAMRALQVQARYRF